MQEWLDDYCGTSEGVVGGAVMVSNPDDGALAVVAENTSSLTQSEELSAAARASFEAGVPHLSDVNEPGTNSEEPTQVVSLPLRDGDEPVGAVALELHADSTSASIALADLEQAASAISEALASPKATQSEGESSVLLGLQATILDHEHFDEAATAFVTGMASAFQVDRVAIGFLEQRYTSVCAVSRSADFHSKAELFRALGEAMDEAIEQGVTICFPDNLKPRITTAHAEFVRKNAGSLCTIPLVSRGHAFGALTLERSGTISFSEDEIVRAENVACIVGPILELRHKQEQPWHGQIVQMARKLGAKLFSNGHWQTKAAVYGSAVVLMALLLIPVEHWVGSPARIEGSIQRSLAAPVDGFLKAAYVKPGDLVTAGQVIVEFAEQDLQLEIRQRQSELAQHENTYSAALVRADRTQFVIAQAKSDEVRAQLGLLEQRLSRSRVLAPFDAIVIEGDLSQSIGAPIEKGEVLLTLAPADQFRLIVDVDERDIANIRVDEDGVLALAALPNETLSFEVERITPVANNRDGRNFFEVEGKLNNVPASMRPGLQGVAKIRSMDRSLMWIWTHRFVDWMRIAFWSIGA
jgi:multidrug efflux pump subunit AcrA (membrane-fusion protein)